MESSLRESLVVGVVAERQEVPDSSSRPTQRALLAEGISQHSCSVTHGDAPPWGATCSPSPKPPGCKPL